MAGPGERTEVVAWLMQGDPSVRWQTMRDVLGEPEAKWKKERQRVAQEGWGAELLRRRDPAGTWGGGIYSPKWISTTYTLLLLRELGLPPSTTAGAEGARLAVEGFLGPRSDGKFARRVAELDLCVSGMAVALLSYFKVRDGRTEELVEEILRRQMADGGWNCAYRRHEVQHSSMHTTINVLEGLAEYGRRAGAGPRTAVGEALGRGRDFLLQHRLFRSDKTGRVIREEFTKFSFPPRWHYDVLRALDHFRDVNAAVDPCLAEAIELVESRRGADGCWKIGLVHRGKEFFTLEKGRQPSRLNTLRALRVLRWWRG